MQTHVFLLDAHFVTFTCMKKRALRALDSIASSLISVPICQLIGIKPASVLTIPLSYSNHIISILYCWLWFVFLIGTFL
ncbi:hypothetical protein BDR05DRAFT_497936 [Suillus weaverae]|nr:hypothetical protein BDR05DRAFT_497936 [Suillus weaverae]